MTKRKPLNNNQPQSQPILATDENPEQIEQHEQLEHRL